MADKLRRSLIGYNLFSRLSLVNTIYELYSCTLIGQSNYGYPKREKMSGLRTKIKSLHNGYSDLAVGIKDYSF